VRIGRFGTKRKSVCVVALVLCTKLNSLAYGNHKAQSTALPDQTCEYDYMPTSVGIQQGRTGLIKLKSVVKKV